jgi:choline dehydrogenase
VERHDVVIIGGGTAGCAAAARLVNAGRSVLLLEAGPDYGAQADGRWPGELLTPNVIPDTHDWGYRGVGPVGQDIDQSRARVVGGCSAHNHCGIVWASEASWDEWADHTGGAWNARVIAPYLERGAQALRSGPPAEDQIRPLGQAFLDVARDELGLDLMRDPGLCGRSAGPFHFNIDGGVRFNAAFAYLDPIRSSERLTILDGARAERLEIADGRVQGVVYQRGEETFTLEADEVVVCAGAYDTPTLLMRSGIGDPQALAASGIEPLVELAAVGQSLRDHPAVALLFAPSEQLLERNAAVSSPPWMPMWQTCVKEQSSRCGFDFDLHLYPTEAPGEDGAPLVIVGVSCMRSRSVGTVSLTADGRPAIDHGYLSDEHDIAVLVEGVELARRMFATAPLSALVAAETVPADAELEPWIRASVAHYFHPAGTCRMGTRAGDAVVDPTGAVFGVGNLRVADASVLPVLPNANTNLPVAAVAERIADLMVAAIA